MLHRSIAAIAVLLPCTGAFAGATIAMHAESGDSIILLEGNKMRTQKTGKDAAASEMIYDGDTQTMYLLDGKAKTYTVMTPAKMKAQIGAGQAQMKAAMANMPAEQREKMKAAMEKMDPEARERMEAMMNGGAVKKPAAPDQRRIEKTGKRQTVAGFACEGYRQFNGDKLESQGCTIPFSSAAVSKEDMGSLQKMQEFIKEGGQGLMGGGSSFAQLMELRGFPGEWAHVNEDGTESSKMTLSSIKHGSIPADQFKVPAG